MLCETLRASFTLVGLYSVCLSVCLSAETKLVWFRRTVLAGELVWQSGHEREATGMSDDGGGGYGLDGDDEFIGLDPDLIKLIDVSIGALLRHRRSGGEDGAPPC